MELGDALRTAYILVIANIEKKCLESFNLLFHFLICTFVLRKPSDSMALRRRVHADADGSSLSRASGQNCTLIFAENAPVSRTEAPFMEIKREMSNLTQTSDFRARVRVNASSAEKAGT